MGRCMTIQWVLVVVLATSCGWGLAAGAREEQASPPTMLFSEVLANLKSPDDEIRLQAINAAAEWFTAYPSVEAWGDIGDVFDELEEPAITIEAETNPAVRQAWADAWVTIDRAAVRAGLETDARGNYTPLASWMIDYFLAYEYSASILRTCTNALSQFSAEDIYPHLLWQAELLTELPDLADLMSLWGDELEPLIRETLESDVAIERYLALLLIEAYGVDPFLEDILQVEPDPRGYVLWAAAVALFTHGYVEEALRIADSTTEVDTFEIVDFWLRYHTVDEATDEQRAVIVDVYRGGPVTAASLFLWAEAGGAAEAEAINEALEGLGDDISPFQTQIIKLLIRDEETIQRVLGEWQKAIEVAGPTKGARFNDLYYYTARAVDDPDIIRPLLLSTPATSVLSETWMAMEHAELAAWCGVTENFRIYVLIFAESWGGRGAMMLLEHMELVDPEAMASLYLAAFDGEALAETYPELTYMEDWSDVTREELQADPEYLLWYEYERAMRQLRCEYRLCRRAVEYFAEVRDERALSGLVKMLEDDSPILATYAIPALANQGDPSVIADLEPFLESTIPLQRQYAAVAIETLKATADD